MFFQSKSKTEIRSKYLGNGNSIVITDGNLVTLDNSYVSAETALRNSDVFACVNLVSADIASTQFVARSDYQTVLDHPNQLTNSFSFWQSVVAELMLSGNAFCVIHRDDEQRPINLEFIRNSFVNIKLSDYSKQILYDVNYDDERGVVSNISSADILHFRLLSTDGGLIGVTPLSSLGTELQLQDSSNKMTLKSIAHSVNPGGILNVNRGLLDRDSKDNIRDEFEKSNTGSNVGRTMVLDSSMTYEKLEIQADVLKILQQVDWTREQIAKAFGVPSDMLGKESEHSNIDQIRSLYSTCLNRYINPITSELKEKFQTDVAFDISPVVDPDGSVLENRMSNLVHNGVLSAVQAQTILARERGDFYG